MHRRRRRPAPWIIAAVLLAAPPVLAAKTFFPFSDAEKQFTGELPGAKDSLVTVERQVVDGFQLDGPEGYTAFLVRSRGRTGASQREDLLTLFLPGQYRLLGYDRRANSLYGARLRQFERTLWISAVYTLEAPPRTALPLGPPGRYQYASFSPGGEALVLVDRDVTIVEVATERWARLEVDPPLTGVEAAGGNPGATVLDGVNLSGQRLEMVWKGETGGRLEVRDASGKAVREITVDLAGLD